MLQRAAWASVGSRILVGGLTLVSLAWVGGCGGETQRPDAGRRTDASRDAVIPEGVDGAIAPDAALARGGSCLAEGRCLEYFGYGDERLATLETDCANIDGDWSVLSCAMLTDDMLAGACRNDHRDGTYDLHWYRAPEFTAADVRSICEAISLPYVAPR